MNRIQNQRSVRSLTWLAAAGFIAMGCSGEPDWRDAAQASIPWLEARRVEAALLALVYHGGRHAATPEEMALDAALDVSSRLGACVTTMPEGDRVVYTFDGCDGAWGLSGLRGAMTATYSLEEGIEPGDRIHIAISASRLAADGQTLSFNYIGGNANPRGNWGLEKSSLIWLSNPSAPDSYDEVQDLLRGLQADYWINDCPESDTIFPRIISSHGDLGIETTAGQSATMEAIDYGECGNECPSEDAEIVVELGATSVEVGFDGTPRAQATYSKDGDTVMIDLPCSP